jgi:hypothetical protein
LVLLSDIIKKMDINKKMINELTKTASDWILSGQSIIPIKYRDKRPEIATWEPYKSQLPSEKEVLYWFPDKFHNLAIITGVQGLAVVDFDSMDQYVYWKIWLQQRHNLPMLFLMDQTYKVQTARGMHVYLRLPHDERNRALEGIDVKAKGGYVLAPPSVHPSGVPYKAVNPGAPIVHVDALSDILPSVLLTRDTELPDDVIVPGAFKNPVKFSDDPWEIAENQEPGGDLIARIRQSYRVEDFFPSAVASSADGRWMLARCPFHEDKSPSFWLDTHRQICGCYAGCTRKPLDVINLYGRLHGLNNRDAILMMVRGL